VGRILVTNTGAFLSERIPARIALCRDPLVGRFLVQGLNGFAWPATWMAVERPLSPAAKAGFLAPYGSPAVRRAVADFVADIPMEPAHPTRSVLAGVEASLAGLKGKPMLLCWGMRDFCFDRSFLEGFRERFPDAFLTPPISFCKGLMGSYFWGSKNIHHDPFSCCSKGC